MQYVPTRAGDVAVEIRGAGIPLVLLHAVAHDHRDYDAVVPTLARTFRTIAVDWPGHGRSAMWAPPSSASAASVFDVLEDVVDALDLPPAVFMGSSVGGAASLRLAARKPERVRGLVLVDTGGLVGRALLPRAFCWVQGRPVVRRWTGMAFARAYLAMKNAGTAALLERIAEGRTRPGFVEMDAAMWRSFGDAGGDLSDLASAVRCKTLIVWGRRDPVLRARVEGGRVRRLLPEAEYLELDTGHVPFVERPEAFLQGVLPFLERVGASG
jgi:pimeloyl-ACP methyl ester carboxylesterase